MMHQEQPSSDTPNPRRAIDTGDIDRQIVQQQAAIHAIEQRLAAASRPRDRFTFEGLRNELSIERELATALDARGSLVYDRNVGRATHST
jgi:hypothetical protein